MGENPTDIRNYYQPLTCKDSAGNEYICLNKYEAIAVEKLIEKIRNDPNLHFFNTGDWFADVPFKIKKWLDQPND